MSSLLNSLPYFKKAQDFFLLMSVLMISCDVWHLWELTKNLNEYIMCWEALVNYNWFYRMIFCFTGFLSHCVLVPESKFPGLRTTGRGKVLFVKYYVLRYCALYTCHSLSDSHGITIYYLHFKDKNLTSKGLSNFINII